MSDNFESLAALGWSRAFEQQLSAAERETAMPVRVFALNRHLVDGVGAAGRQQFSLPSEWLSLAAEELPTVGDWLLIDRDGQPLRLLERTSLFKRMASGRESRVQLMAANVDTLFVVTSCNQDFSLSRLERYLALALDSGVEPVVVLTKADLADDATVAEMRADVLSLHPGLAVLAVNSRSATVIEQLSPWCRHGRTVALAGSSGVGKSTLVNSLSRATVQETGATRAGDCKGRHTTTARTLHLLPGGGLLLDSPGLRELQLGECETGLADLFAEIEEIATRCRFSDCRHLGEAGCAVAEAAEAGSLDPRRFANYLKLKSEQARTAETLVEKRRKDKNFGRMVKSAQALKRKNDN